MRISDRKYKYIQRYKAIKKEFDFGDIDRAYDMLLAYLVDYPNSEYGLSLLGMILIKKGELEQAETVFDELLNTSNRNYALANLMIIYAEDDRLADLMRCCDELLSTEKNPNVLRTARELKVYVCKRFRYKLDIPYQHYYESQIYNYDRERAIRRVIGSKFHNIEKDSKLAEDIDVDSLFDGLDQLLEVNDRHLTYGSPLDCYYFKFDRVMGISHKKPTQFIRVNTTFKGKEIVSLFPVDASEAVNVIQYNPESATDPYEQEEEKSPVKVKNGLDRFYSRYPDFKK